MKEQPLYSDAGSPAVIYASDWTHHYALTYIFSAASPEKWAAGTVRSRLKKETNFIPDKYPAPPRVIILDIPPRRAVALLLGLRKKYPQVFIICTQDRFLFSDRMVAEYFGGMQLKEYDALMAGYPAVRGMDHLTSPLFAGACPPARVFSETVTVAAVLASVDQWLRRRLPGVMSSPRTREVALEWLAGGVSLSDTARCLNRSGKVVYHYRWLMMRALGIRHYSRDFIPSLTVTAGPVYRGGSVGDGVSEQEGVRCMPGE